MNVQKFQVDLDSVITLLSKHIYSSPKVYIRELLQNAVDAIHARKKKDPDFQGAIQLIVNTTPGNTLTFVDNGIGLTEEEVNTLLATVGASTKRDDSGTYLGQFGIGLLSCFMVSAEIVVISKSITGASAVEWKGKADGTFSSRLLDIDCDPGTRVYLQPKPGMESLLSPASVKALATHFGDLLPYPVLFAEDDNPPEQLNQGRSPLALFHAGNVPDEQQLLASGEAIFSNKFLGAIPLRTSRNKTYGVAYILSSPPNLAEKPKNKVYLNNMLLADDNTEILPPWSFFVKAIINTSELKPTASREGLVKDDLLEKVRRQLGRCIRNYLAKLHEDNPELLDNIIRTHQLAMKMLAKDDKELYKIIIHYLKFQTTLGFITIREYLTHSHTIYTVYLAEEYDKMSHIAKAQGIHLINTQFDFDDAIIAGIKRIFPKVKRQHFSFQDLLGSLEVPEKQAMDVTQVLLSTASDELSTFRCTPIIRQFEPAVIPAIQYADDARNFEHYASRIEKELPPVWSSLIEGLPINSGSLVLCLNYHNSFIRNLATMADSPLLRHFIRLLYIQSLLLSNRQLTDKEINLLTNGLDGLLQYFESGDQK